MALHVSLDREKVGDFVDLDSGYNAARYKIISVIKYRHLQGVFILVAKYYESLPGLKAGLPPAIIAKITSPKGSFMYPDEWFVWPHVTNRTWQKMLGEDYDEQTQEIGEIPLLLQVHSFEWAWRKQLFLNGGGFKK